MVRLMAWFDHRPTWRGLFLLVLLMFAAKIVWFLTYEALFYSDELMKMVSDIFSSPQNAPPQGGERKDELSRLLDSKSAAAASLFLFSFAFLEEVIFRFVPLFAALLLFRWWALTRPLVLIVGLISSVLFGLIHMGNEGHEGREYALVVRDVVAIQGVAGLLYSILFLKYAGFKMRHSFAALLVTTSTHFCWNGLLMLGLPYLVMTFVGV